MDQFGERVAVEHGAWLPGVGFDGRRIDLAIHGTQFGGLCDGDRGAAQDDVGCGVAHPVAELVAITLGGAGRDQRGQASAKAGSLARLSHSDVTLVPFVVPRSAISRLASR